MFFVSSPRRIQNFKLRNLKVSRTFTGRKTSRILFLQRQDITVGVLVSTCGRCLCLLRRVGVAEQAVAYSVVPSCVQRPWPRPTRTPGLRYVAQKLRCRVSAPSTRAALPVTVTDCCRCAMQPRGRPHSSLDCWLWPSPATLRVWVQAERLELGVARSA